MPHSLVPRVIGEWIPALSKKIKKYWAINVRPKGIQEPLHRIANFLSKHLSFWWNSMKERKNRQWISIILKRKRSNCSICGSRSIKYFEPSVSAMNWLIDWLIDFNCISTRLGLLYTEKLEKRVHYPFIFTFFVRPYLKRFFAYGRIEYK